MRVAAEDGRGVCDGGTGTGVARPTGGWYPCM